MADGKDDELFNSVTNSNNYSPQMFFVLKKTKCKCLVSFVLKTRITKDCLKQWLSYPKGTSIDGKSNNKQKMATKKELTKTKGT
mgnify:CR=1 FL=1